MSSSVEPWRACIDVTYHPTSVSDSSVPSAFPGKPRPYRELLERVPGVVGLWSPAEPFDLLYMSAGVLGLTGYTAQEHLADPGLWERITHPDDRTRTWSAFTNAATSGIRFRHEYRIIRKDGSSVWVEGTLDPILDEAGQITAWQGYSLDITTRRAAEEAAARSESRFRALTEQLPVVVYVDTDEIVSRCLYISRNVEDVFGLDQQEFLTTPGLWYRNLHPEDVQGARAAWREAVEAGEAFHREYRVVKPDGAITWVRDSCIPIPGPDGSTLLWHGVFLDITAEKQAEAELLQSESRYRVLVEQIPAVVYEMDPDDERRPAYMSPHIEEMLGHSSEEWLDQPDIWTELLHPEDRERELAAHDLHNATGEPWSREYRLIAHDGEVVWVRDQAVLVTDPVSGTSTWHGVMLDITDQKQAEIDLEIANELLAMRVRDRTDELAEANALMGLEIGERRRMETELRTSEEHLRLLVGQLPDVVYVFHVDEEHAGPTVEVYNGARLTRMVGYSAQAWQTDPDLWKSRLHPDDRERVLTDIQRCIDQALPYADEYRFLAKDGSIVWVSDRCTVLTRRSDGRAASFSGIMVDITDRKEAELRARDAQRRFEDLAERGPAISFMFERDEGQASKPRLTYMSPQIEQITGWTRERFLADPLIWRDILDANDLEQLTTVVPDVLRDEDHWSGEFDLRTATGSTVRVRSQLAVLQRDGAGEAIIFQGVMTEAAGSPAPLRHVEPGRTNAGLGIEEF
jgi:PAS domain S-box-containing protein